MIYRILMIEKSKSEYLGNYWIIQDGIESKTKWLSVKGHEVAVATELSELIVNHRNSRKSKR